LDRSQQLKDLFGVTFPSDLMAFWGWYTSLTPQQRTALGEDAGVRVCGICDVLAGRFDGVELRYPAVLHYRYHLDLPEFFTVLGGDTDGLHWGYWLDAPDLPAVVVGNYARDAYEFWVEGDDLLGALEHHLEHKCEGLEELATDDKKHAAHHRSSRESVVGLITSLRKARKTWLPSRPQHGARTATVQTTDGIGIVVPPAAWDPARVWDWKGSTSSVNIHNAREVCSGADPRPGVALYVGRQLWPRDRALAAQVLERAYLALGREALARVVMAHVNTVNLPNVDVLKFKRGDYLGLEEARATPLEVRRLNLGNLKLTTLPDLSVFSGMTILEAWGNALTALPEGLAACSALEEVQLHGNQLSQVPPVLAALPRLRKIQLTQNRLEQFDGPVGPWPHLRELLLSGNRLRSLPDAVADLDLETLGVGNNPLTVLPQRLGLMRLVYLGLENTALERLPADLSGWGGLKRVSVKGTKLPPAEVERLVAAAPHAQVVV
jgi:hypothetical protein